MSELFDREQMASNWARLREKQDENRKKAEEELRRDKEEQEAQEKKDQAERERLRAEKQSERVASITPQEKDQLQRLGRALVNHKRGQSKKATIKVEEKKGRGRPKKEQGEKVQLVQAKLSPYYVTFLKDYGKSFKKEKGIPSTLRHMIFQFEIYQERERRQVQKVRMMLREIESLFGQYGSRYQRPDKTLETKAIKEQISERINRVRTLVSLLEFVGCRYDEKKRGEEKEPKDRYHDYLADLLSVEERRTYEMTKIWTEQLLPQ